MLKGVLPWERLRHSSSTRAFLDGGARCRSRENRHPFSLGRVPCPRPWQRAGKWSSRAQPRQHRSCPRPRSRSRSRCRGGWRAPSAPRSGGGRSGRGPASWAASSRPPAGPGPRKERHGWATAQAMLALAVARDAFAPPRADESTAAGAGKGSGQRELPSQAGVPGPAPARLPSCAACDAGQLADSPQPHATTTAGPPPRTGGPPDFGATQGAGGQGSRRRGQGASCAWQQGVFSHPPTHPPSCSRPSPPPGSPGRGPPAARCARIPAAIRGWQAEEGPRMRRRRCGNRRRKGGQGRRAGRAVQLARHGLPCNHHARGHPETLGDMQPHLISGPQLVAEEAGRVDDGVASLDASLQEGRSEKCTTNEGHQVRPRYCSRSLLWDHLAS